MAEGPVTTKVDGRPLGVVSSAHFMVDAYSNMYAPLLPLLMPRLGMSLQAAGTLMMVYQAAASLSQLLFGRLADRGYARALLVANAAGTYGLGSTLWFLLPGLACGLLFARAVPALPLAPHRPHGGGLRALRPQARNLFLLYALVVLRTVVSLSFATFVPVLLTRQGMSVGEAGTAMALYLFMSGIGGFWGGTLADRFGPRRVITWSLLLSTPFLLAAPQTTGWTFALLLAVGGLFLQSTLPVNVSFGQALAPHSAATVSSLMMGVAWGTGGMLVPVTGMVADTLGLPVTLTILAAVPLAAAGLSTWLPSAPPLPMHVEPVEVNVAAVDPSADENDQRT